MRSYQHPPVIEALCELFFEGSEWDDAVFGRFYDLVKDRFPQRRQLELQEAQFTLSPAGESVAGIRRLPPQMQFLTEQGNLLLQLRRDLLVINQLRPYPESFEVWEPHIYWALQLYAGLTKAKSIKKVGLRYINRIIVPEPVIRMEDYFNIYPQLPTQMGDEHGPFMVRVELPSGQEAHRLLITFASAPADQAGQTAHLLDLYDIFEQEMTVAEDQVRRHIRQAQKNVERAFEGSITDRLRAIFRPK